ncbi:hypothetical protein BRADI_4g25199v3 [Brachypodium distachyon]|uniref:KIB1-4 beta-propeller domain-containing protein n=1 Tax=Brachypodium distachyon TaxID=15368 RepID=A0A0Q3ITB1_BRADI|nr:hypothetical protein BRADI_4g25199v3 [Brachypodium distachyon]
MAGSDEPASSLWSDLPTDLAGLVLRQVPSYADRARFASVCRHLRYAAKLLLQSPSTIRPALPWLKILDGDRRTFRSLPDGELHRLPRTRPPPLLSANMGWLLFQDAGGRQYLKNPLSGAVLRLPVQCKAPAIRHDSEPSSSSSCNSDEFQIQKVIACTRDNAVAALISYRGLPSTVAYCRPGNNTPPWSMGRLVLPGPPDTWYEDMAIFKSRAYTVTLCGDLWAHDITQLGTAAGEVHVSPRVDHVIMGPASAGDLDGAYAYMACSRRSFLVTSARGDKLRMVRWIVPYDQHLIPGQCRRGCTACAAAKTMEFKVFEAADMESGGRWVELERLDDDEVLFISAHCSKAMSIGSMSSKSNYGGVRGGQIYFAGGDLSSWFFGDGPITRCPTRTCGVYDMRTKLISPISSKWPISDQSPAAWFFPFVDHSGNS